MQRVLSYRDTLGAKGVVKLLDAEGCSCVCQQVPLHPAKRNRVRHSVSFNNVAQYDHIDIALKQRKAVARVGSSSFRKPAFDEVRAQPVVQVGPEGLGEPAFERFRFSAGMSERLSKTKGVNQDFQSSAAHAGSDLPAQ